MNKKKETGSIWALMSMTLDKIFGENNVIHLYYANGPYKVIRIICEGLDLPMYIQSLMGDREALAMEEDEYQDIAEYWYDEYTDDPEIVKVMASEKIKELFGGIPYGHIHIFDDTLHPIHTNVLSYEGQTLQQLCFGIGLGMPEWAETLTTTEYKVWE